MKTTVILGIISMVAGVLPLGCFASGLVPEQCTIGERPVYYPIVDIGFTFDRAIQTTDNSVATIYMDNTPVAAGTISSSNYVGKNRTQGSVVVSFDHPLILPKGKSYTLVVPKGVISAETSSDMSNDELRVDFEVPATIGFSCPSIENGSVVTAADRIGFYFDTETASIENREIILYREGIPIRTYPCDVSWDWNLGYAGVDFGESIKFEAGVRYSVKLPENSVSAYKRPDIMNEAVSVDFVGGYAEPVQSIQYVWCSLYEDHPGDVLGEVRFYYNQEIALSCNSIVQLVMDGSQVVKEVTPTLSTQNNQWVLSANFEDTPLITGKGYSVVIPEGTLVTPTGDVVVNSRNVMSIDNSSGISQVEDNKSTISIQDGLLTVEGIKAGDEVKIYSIDGKKLYSTVASSESVSMRVPDADICILTVNGKTKKINIHNL